MTRLLSRLAVEAGRGPVTSLRIRWRDDVTPERAELMERAILDDLEVRWQSIAEVRVDTVVSEPALFAGAVA